MVLEVRCAKVYNRRLSISMRPEIEDCILHGRSLRFRHMGTTQIRAKDGMIVWYKLIGRKVLILHVTTNVKLVVE